MLPAYHTVEDDANTISNSVAVIVVNRKSIHKLQPFSNETETQIPGKLKSKTETKSRKKDSFIYNFPFLFIQLN